MICFILKSKAKLILRKYFSIFLSVTKLREAKHVTLPSLVEKEDYGS